MVTLTRSFLFLFTTQKIYHAGSEESHGQRMATQWTGYLQYKD